MHINKAFKYIMKATENINNLYDNGAISKSTRDYYLERFEKAHDTLYTVEELIDNKLEKIRELEERIDAAKNVNDEIQSMEEMKKVCMYAIAISTVVNMIALNNGSSSMMIFSAVVNILAMIVVILKRWL